MTLRKVFFWFHLVLGVTAGVGVFIMSVTGLLLTYEKQMISWADRGYRSAPSSGATRLPVDVLLGKIRDTQQALPATLVMRADPAAPAEASFGRERTLFVNPYTGQVLGTGNRGIRTFFRTMTDWHRWLGREAKNRAPARAFTGASNLLFLFIVCSGLYLWLPRKLTWQHIRPVLLLRGGLSGKARDFNWHNVFGFWTAVPLFFIVLTALPMSYPWANALLFRLAGSPLPVPGAGPGGPPPEARPREGQRAGGPRRETRAEGQGRRNAAPQGPGPAGPPVDLNVEGLGPVWSRAEQRVSGWQTISLRLPANERAPLAFTIDQAGPGRPDKRLQLTLDRSTGEVVREEAFADFNLGRRLRSWARWVHTGEAGGLPGQTIAGIASGAGALLVWTGFALTWRRFRAWQARRKPTVAPVEKTELVRS